MKIKVLITCYNGNFKKIIDYLDKSKFEIVLYNKKNSDFGIPVKNVGVDAYDKFHFIVNNYDNLPDIVIFTTDNALVEKKKIKKLKYIIKNIDILKEKSGFLTGHIFKIPDNEIEHKLDIYPRTGKKVITAPIRPYDKWFNKFIKNDINVKNTFTSKKSIFAVTKDLILSNSKNFYIDILNQIEKYSIEGPDSEVPHYLELAYVEIFCKNKKELMYHDFKTYGDIT